MSGRVGSGSVRSRKPVPASSVEHTNDSASGSDDEGLTGIGGAGALPAPNQSSSETVPLAKAPQVAHNLSLTSPFSSLDWFERNEKLVAWLTFFIGFVTRFYRLDQPRGVVFDETHFGKFTGWYTENKFYFDIHPPLGKLTFWFFGKLMGYDPSKCEFIDLNRPYGPECKYHLLRGVAASFSTLTMPIMFYCARNFGASVKFAFLASMLVCFDMLNLGEGRLILMDSQLIFWLMATLLIGQEWWRRLNAHELWLAINSKTGGAATSVVSSFSSALRPLAAPQRLTLVQRYLWAVAVGICCGNAINVKMTGLVTPAMIALESFWGIWFLLKPISFLELLTTLGSAILTYSAWFGVSFWLFVNSGPNKVEQEFMTPLFQATLVNSDNYDPTGNALREWRAKEGFWWTMITHNARMIKHNANILAPHPWQTTWYEWVLNLRGVAYYGKDEAHRYHTQVYLLGNPAVIWSVLAAIVLSVVTLIVYVRYRASFSAGAGVHSFAKHATFCLLAYLLNLLPYFGVARSTFIYHYMPALVFAQIVTARFLETLLPTRWHSGAIKLYMLGILAMFLYHSAWLYAYPILPEAHDRRRWLPRWN